MAFDYTNLPASITRAVLLSGVTGIDVLISDRLEDSAATLSGLIYYRVQYVAAVTIKQNRADQTLKSAEGGVGFRGDTIGLEPIVRSLLEEQAALDAAKGWEVPKGFEADVALEKLCGCSAKSTSSNGGSTSDFVPVMSIMVG